MVLESNLKTLSIMPGENNGSRFRHCSLVRVGGKCAQQQLGRIVALH